MEAEWRDAGIGYDTLEIWAVGYPGQEGRVVDMAGDGTDTIMVDTSEPTESAIVAYDAHANDVFVIDVEGCLAAWYNAGVNPLTDEANRAFLDDIVMTVVSE
jgi:hypothetical protein